MKAIIVHEFGELADIRIEERSTSKPRDGAVLIYNVFKLSYVCVV